MLDPLRPTGGAGRIEHDAAGRRIGDRFGREGVPRRFEALVAVGGPVAHEALHVGNQGVERQGDVLDALRGDQHAATAIADDVLGLRRGQLRRDAGAVDAGALGRPQHLEIARAVVHEDGHAVAALQAERAKQLRALVGALVELAEAHRLARAGHDVGRLVRGRERMADGMGGRRGDIGHCGLRFEGIGQKNIGRALL
jgi:hypothetical protein